MADRDDKDTSYGGSQGGRGTSTGSSAGSARNDTPSSGRSNGGLGNSGGGYGGSPGGSSGGGYGWGGGGGSSAGSARSDTPSSGRSNGGLGRSGGGSSGGGGVGGRETSHSVERGIDRSLSGGRTSTPTGFQGGGNIRSDTPSSGRINGGLGSSVGRSIPTPSAHAVERGRDVSLTPTTARVGVQPATGFDPTQIGGTIRSTLNAPISFDLHNRSRMTPAMTGIPGQSMAGTEVAPAHANVGPTGFSLDNRNRMTPAMGSVASGIGPTTDLPTGTRIGEIKSMGDMARYNLRESIKPPESGPAGTDQYGRMVAGGPVSYNKGLYDGSMTLDDVRELQKGMKGKYPSTAVGAYQVIDTTLNAAAKRMGLPGDTVMTEAVWDAIGDDLIDNRVKQASAMKGGLTPENLGHQLANEWAAFASPKTGKGVYDNVGKNRATVPAAQVEAYARDFINNNYTKEFASNYLGTTGGVPAGSATPNVPTSAGAPTSTPAPRGTEAAAGGTVTTPAAPPGTQGFPATPPKQAQAPGFPSFKTPATGFTRGLGASVAAPVIDAVLGLGGPVGLALQAGAFMLTGDTAGGTMVDMVGGKYGPNQYAPGKDDKYSGDRAGGAGSGKQNSTGVNKPETISQTPITKPGTTPTNTTTSPTPTAQEFIATYIDPTPRPTPFQQWGDEFGWSKNNASV